MYQPNHFREDRLDVQHQLICAHPFGLLISMGSDGLEADGLPFMLHGTEGRLGVLRAHLARANGHWRTLNEQKVLIVFQGPAAYISPSHYKTKQDTGKVVPTWNYAMVQVRGAARVIEESEWLSQQVNALTGSHERLQPKPWAVSDAPAAYIEGQLRGIVGIEITIESIDGKWKMSQNRSAADRSGVVQGLSRSHPVVAELVGKLGKSE
jgi:transcriptional regulator